MAKEDEGFINKMGERIALIEEVSDWPMADLQQLRELAQAANALKRRRRKGWNLLDYAAEVLLPALGAA